jgi:hypothetical protein
MKIVNYIFAVIFLGFAAVQYNDPDALVWIAIYMAMAIVCLLATRRRYYKPLSIILALVYVLYATLLSPSVLIWWQSGDRSQLFDEPAKMQFLYIEEAREFLGLMICLVILAINYLYFGIRKRKA